MSILAKKCKMINCYIDGACEPVNPGGIATYGFVIYQGDQKLATGSGIVQYSATNNIAEYGALYFCLVELSKLGKSKEKITVHSDSQLVIQQMNKKWRVKHGGYVQYWKKVQEIIGQFPDITFTWIPGTENVEADSLSRENYKL